MIEALQLRVEGSEAVRIPVSEVFAELGPKFHVNTVGDSDGARSQFRLQLAWPSLRLEIAKRNLHLRLAKRYGDAGAAARIDLSPVYAQLVAENRNPLRMEDVVMKRVESVLIFTVEGPGVTVAHLYAHSDPAVIFLLSRLHDGRVTTDVEFLWVPLDAWSCTPQKQIIHADGHGRLYPGPDLVQDGTGPHLHELLPVRLNRNSPLYESVSTHDYGPLSCHPAFASDPALIRPQGEE